jgi:hypothetical protein
VGLCPARPNPFQDELTFDLDNRENGPNTGNSNNSGNGGNTRGATTAMKRTCHKCGKPVERNAHKCHNCGYAPPMAVRPTNYKKQLIQPEAVK